jgi:hypothetical protein
VLTTATISTPARGTVTTLLAVATHITAVTQPTSATITLTTASASTATITTTAFHATAITTRKNNSGLGGWKRQRQFCYVGRHLSNDEYYQWVVFVR